MASMVSQLLTKREVDLSQWSAIYTLEAHQQMLVSRDLGYLCALFKHLVSQLQYGTIFCIVDDFYVIEHSDEDDSLTQVVKCLSEVVQTAILEDRITFKILAMTPDRKGSVVGYANHDDALLVQTGSRMGPQAQGMTPKQQRFQMGYARRKAGGGWQ